VARRLKPELFADPALHLFEFRRKEFSGIAARGTHHVVMRAAVQAMLVACDSVLEVDLKRQAALSKQLDRPIDGRVPDARILSFHQVVQFLRAQMLPGVQEYFKHSVTLGTLL